MVASSGLGHLPCFIGDPGRDLLHPGCRWLGKEIAHRYVLLGHLILDLCFGMAPCLLDC